MKNNGQDEHELIAAISGGPLVRESRFPCRNVMGKSAFNCVKRVFEYYWEKGQDIPYQAHFEDIYCEQFAAFYGGGYADAVNSGSVAVYLAVQALALPKHSKVLISPVTDPGSVSAVLLAGHTVVIADSAPGSFNASPDSIEDSLDKHPDIKAALLTHVGGLPLDLPAISALLKIHNIPLIEDCSQIHGGKIGDQKVGTFGRMSVFSTMYTKNQTTGSTGGVVLCKEKSDYWLVRSLADRRKPFDHDDFNPRDPGAFLGAGLNFNANEIACALGSQSLAKLPAVIEQRQQQVDYINRFLEALESVTPVQPLAGSLPSYFFHNVVFNDNWTDHQVNVFKTALEAEKTSVNANYLYVVSEWNWLRSQYGIAVDTPNATRHRARSLNILFHEKYTNRDLDDICLALKRAEHYTLHSANIE